eukprot:764998-Hanusia_phi.AAC.8
MMGPVTGSPTDRSDSVTESLPPPNRLLSGDWAARGPPGESAGFDCQCHSRSIGSSLPRTEEWVSTEFSNVLHTGRLNQ